MQKILETLWGWGRVNLKENMLVARGVNKLTAWELAAKRGNKKIQETLRRCGREVQANLKDDMLPAKNYCILSVWHTATEGGYAQRNKYFISKHSKPCCFF